MSEMVIRTICASVSVPVVMFVYCRLIDAIKEKIGD